MEHNSRGPGRPPGRNGRAHAGIAVEASGIDPEVRGFAARQIFSQSGKIEPATEPRRSFDRVVAELHDSEINVGMQSFCFCGLRVWIGDPLNGIQAEASFGPDNKAWMIDGSLARWLHETAVRLYPDSAYATARPTEGAPL